MSTHSHNLIQVSHRLLGSTTLYDSISAKNHLRICLEWIIHSCSRQFYTKKLKKQDICLSSQEEWMPTTTDVYVLFKELSMGCCHRISDSALLLLLIHSLCLLLLCFFPLSLFHRLCIPTRTLSEHQAVGCSIFSLNLALVLSSSNHFAPVKQSNSQTVRQSDGMKIERTLFSLPFLALFLLFLPPSSSSSSSVNSNHVRHLHYLTPSSKSPSTKFHHHYHDNKRQHDHESLSLLTPASLTSLCPSICSCKWKGGKKTVSCINSGLHDLPSGIEVDTQVIHLNDNDLSEAVLSASIFAEYGLTSLQKIYLSR